MKKNEYKVFKTIVAHAGEQNPIWWEGYYWMNLTGNQCKDIIDLLETKPFIKPAKTLTGKDSLMMPSGLMIHY